MERGRNLDDDDEDLLLIFLKKIFLDLLKLDENLLFCSLLILDIMVKSASETVKSLLAAEKVLEELELEEPELEELELLLPLSNLLIITILP